MENIIANKTENTMHLPHMVNKRKVHKAMREYARTLTNSSWQNRWTPHLMLDRSDGDVWCDETYGNEWKRYHSDSIIEVDAVDYVHMDDDSGKYYYWESDKLVIELKLMCKDYKESGNDD